MSFTSIAVPQHIITGRRSCEASLSSNYSKKTDCHINHRSLHSDPGVCFELISRRSDSSLLSYSVMKKLEAARADLQTTIARYQSLKKGHFYLNSAVTHEAQVGKARLVPPMYCYPTQQCLYGSEGLHQKQPVEKLKSQHDQKLFNQGRVISTSLSSSATSLYSEDDYFRSSINASPVPSFTSDCPSVASDSRRNSFCWTEEEDKDSITLQEEIQHEMHNRGIAGENAISVQIYSSNNDFTSEDGTSKEIDNEDCVAASILPVVSEENTEENDSTPQTPLSIMESQENFWSNDENEERFPRMNSSASSVGSPSFRNSPCINGFGEDSEQGSVHVEKSSNIQIRKTWSSRSKSSEKLLQIAHDNNDSKSSFNKALKQKGNGFLRRVGDFKILSTSPRKDLQRANSSDGTVDRASTQSLESSDNRLKTWRKARKIIISEPILQNGHEKLNQLKCVAIDEAVSEIKKIKKQNSSQSLTSCSSSATCNSSVSNASTISQSKCPENLTQYKRPKIEEQNSCFQSCQIQSKSFPSSLSTKLPVDNLSDIVCSSSTSEADNCEADSNVYSSSEESSDFIRPISMYDNLIETNLSGNVSLLDVLKIMDCENSTEEKSSLDVFEDQVKNESSESDAAFWSVDEIVKHTQSLQQMVVAWEAEEEIEEDAEKTSESEQIDRRVPTTLEVTSQTAENEIESKMSPHNEGFTHCQPRWILMKKESNDIKPLCEECLQLHSLSAGQLMILKRLSALKLDSLMAQQVTNNKGIINWSVPRFIRRMKDQPDYKDKNVFGVPLLHNVQRYGHPLPKCILNALDYLRETALKQIGLFRKSGVRTRIQQLRAKCEHNPDLNNFDCYTAYDVADMVKQYFRELPDPLMTMKMSSTFVGVFFHLPEDLWLSTLQSAIMLLPDETRESLKTLLLFLADVASKSDDNQMTACNLSTCLSPTLFYQHLSSSKVIGASISPKTRKLYGGSKPEMKDMNENKAASQCLGFMIRHVGKLFKISEDAMTQCRMSVMQQVEDVLATEIGHASELQNEEDYFSDFHSFVDRTVAQTLREEQRIAQNKGGWQSIPSASGSELMSKKLNDGNPLRLWRSQVEVLGANPSQIKDRILNERHLWDEDLLQSKVIQEPDERTQLFETVRAEMSSQPSRGFCVLRSWRNDINSKGAAAIIETSTGSQGLLGNVRGVVLTSRYIIEPTDVPNKCKLTHMSRVDTKGRSPEWHNKAYGHIVSQQLLRIRDSIQKVPPKEL